MSVNVSLWLTAAAILLISLFSVRVFALMHECGHGSLFCIQRLNRTFGFLLGDSILRDEPEDTPNPLDEDLLNRFIVFSGRSLCFCMFIDIKFLDRSQD